MTNNNLIPTDTLYANSLLVTNDKEEAEALAEAIGLVDICSSKKETQSEYFYHCKNNSIVCFLPADIKKSEFVPVDASEYNESFKEWNLKDLPIIPEKIRFSYYSEDNVLNSAIKELTGYLNTPDRPILISTTKPVIDMETSMFNLHIFLKLLLNAPKPILFKSFDSLTDAKKLMEFDALRLKLEFSWLYGLNLTRLTVLMGFPLRSIKLDLNTLLNDSKFNLKAVSDGLITANEYSTYHKDNLKNIINKAKNIKE